jgi:hypothetical protein
MDEKKEKERGEQKDDHPAEKGKPVLAGFEDVQSREKFPENFGAAWNVQFLVSGITVRRGV